MRLEEIVPVLMCGGEGKRLRPLSRKSCPKPFIRVWGQDSLFQKTLKRVVKLAPPIILTRWDLKDIVVEQVGEVEFVLEPCAKNTAPAILKMCLEAVNPDQYHLFLPTDHEIQDMSPLLEVIENIGDCEGQIILFGIEPDCPATRYGYIGQSPVEFHEKPSPDLATSYIEKGFLWNSGMVLATPRTILEEAEKYIPEILALVRDNRYQEIESISFDYAVLEKSEIIKCCPVKMSWMDVGTWGSFLTYFRSTYEQSYRKAKY
ncbi:MAG: sugar phosphate nucleotidyltransferase [Bdellovibrionales bacterium]